MIRTIVALTLTLIILMLTGCSQTSPPARERILTSVDDPLTLEYRFNIEDEFANPNPTLLYPIDLFDDGRQGAVIVGNMWNPPAVQSLIIFYSDIHHQQALHHINVNTAALSPPYIYDFNHDGVQEVLTTYIMNDSLWLETFRLDSASIYRRFIATGIDRDNSGNWDGGGMICMVEDLNGDGYKEVLVNCDVGYDLYPRAIHCIDAKNDSLLWSYPLAGVACHASFALLHQPDDPDTLIIFGVSSKGNAAVTDDMDDQHSYLIAIDKHGREQWKHITGGSFTSGLPLIIDYDSDGYSEIACFQNAGESSQPSGKIDTLKAVLRIYSQNGVVVDSLCFDEWLRANDARMFDIDSDGTPEIILELSDNSMRVYDQKLHEKQIIHCASRFGIWDCRDFLGVGENQLLFDLHNTGLLLTDKNLNPLALFNAKRNFERIAYRVLRRNPDQECVLLMALRDHLTFYFLTLKSTPWYTIFSRRPILAFLAAFVPLTIIIGIIWLVLAKFRQKNKIISLQRDRLDETLTKLREAQEQLVAAEKYKMSKDIAGGVAHEIHNALFPARSSLQKLKERLGLTDPKELTRNHTLLELGEKAVVRALKMVELVRVYTRLDLEKKAEPTNIREVMDEILDANSLQISESNITVQTEIPNDITVACFRPHLYSLLNNLVVNALQAMTDTELKRLTVMATKTDGTIEIAVSDTGSGIAKENQLRIFDAFFSTRLSSGTGLGLSIVKRIVELHDGKITVKSSLEKGTTFRILLPVS